MTAGADAIQVAREPRNASVSWLTRAQGEEQLMDLTSQCGRWSTDGTAELRGNGMFVRRDALEAVGGWNPRALTEDLDLSTRLVANGRHVTLAPDVAVTEEAVEALGALWRQRLRWAEGSLRRLLEHGPGLLLGPLPLSRKADFLAFAGEFLVPPLFAATVVASLATVPLPRPADWSVPAALFLSYGIGIFLLALGGLWATGERGPRVVGRAARGALFLSHWLLVVPVVLVRIAFGPERTRIRPDASLHRRPGPMSAQRAELVVAGRVVLAAEPDGLETAEAVGIAAGRVVSAGTRSEVTDAAARGARVIDAGEAAVIPGLHDFHIHLVGLARTRGAIALDDAADGAEVAAGSPRQRESGNGEAWLTGRGWSERQLAGVDAAALDAAAGERLAFLTSHDGHSAWASPVARRLAGLGAETSDPPGGRLERGAGGEPTGILRETAMDLVAPLVTRLQGAALHAALDATLRELGALGVTGASEAGDYTDRNGIGADAALGDSYSTLTDLGDLVDGRLRLTLGIPADAVPAAARARPADGRSPRRSEDHAVRLGQGVRGWSARVRHRGALRAALLRIARCGHPASVARGARCALRGWPLGGNRAGGARHRRPRRRGRPRCRRARAGAPARHAPSDRLEHAQLLRRDEVDRFARLGVTASIQPIHAAADRDLVEACWDGRQDRAYAWRSLLSAGTHLAAGSDAPVESVNPWLGLFAAVHRRLPTDPRGDWRSAEALTIAEALSAYTLGPARALGAHDEGHLRPGARADLAVLSVDLDTLLAADERLQKVRAELAIVDGVEVPIA